MPPNVLIIGTGEYSTGYVQTSHGAAADKKAGVVGLVCFDLRRRGKIGPRIVFAGTCGEKFPMIRKHFEEKIANEYSTDISFESYPGDSVARDPIAYVTAIQSMNKGDLAIVFTPDNTHFQICSECITHGLHVLVTKPAVQTLDDHLALAKLSAENKSLVAIEMHKRFDPIYVDAVDRISKELGDFSYFFSYMSQPKFQLNTFAKWAGTGSDISYYLNSHHVDFLCHSLENTNFRPISVTGSRSTGLAKGKYDLDCDDTITLLVEWESNNGDQGVIHAHSTHTASWIASERSEVHSQQRFFYLGQKGEVRVDQAHRGYEIATDSCGYKTLNPLYMRYSKDAKGHFGGQSGYGYISIERFVDLATDYESGELSLGDAEKRHAILTSNPCITTTLILEGGRRSLLSGRKTKISYDGMTPRFTEQLG